MAAVSPPPPARLRQGSQRIPHSESASEEKKRRARSREAGRRPKDSAPAQLLRPTPAPHPANRSPPPCSLLKPTNRAVGSCSTQTPLDSRRPSPSGYSTATPPPRPSHLPSRLSRFATSGGCASTTRSRAPAPPPIASNASSRRAGTRARKAILDAPRRRADRHAGRAATQGRQQPSSYSSATQLLRKGNRWHRTRRPRPARTAPRP